MPAHNTPVSSPRIRRGRSKRLSGLQRSKPRLFELPQHLNRPLERILARLRRDCKCREDAVACSIQRIWPALHHKREALSLQLKKGRPSGVSRLSWERRPREGSPRGGDQCRVAQE